MSAFDEIDEVAAAYLQKNRAWFDAVAEEFLMTHRRRIVLVDITGEDDEMNKCIIIGNLTRDPEIRTTNEGINVCTFKVAVNKRTSKDHPEVDYFRVVAWRELGEHCAKYLAKGKKVMVVGPVSVNAYEGKDSNHYAELEITASEVEFLSPKDSDSGGGIER